MMKTNQEFRLNNSKSTQTFSLARPEDAIEIKKIVMLSLHGIKKPNDWFEELRKQDLNLKITYANSRGQRTEYTVHLVPFVSPNHARPVFDERVISMPELHDRHILYTTAKVEIFTETPDVPLEVAFVYDALQDAKVLELEDV